MIVPSPLNKKYGTKVYNCDVILKKKDNGWGKPGIHLTTVSIFAGMTWENRYFCDVPQQVLSEVVA